MISPRSKVQFECITLRRWAARERYEITLEVGRLVSLEPSQCDSVPEYSREVTWKSSTKMVKVGEKQEEWWKENW
jgi:hypothetical protein